MSFEDDEYWDEEYSDHSTAPQAAAAPERRFARHPGPESLIPTRRPGADDEFEPGHVDELAARRQRRAAGNAPRRPQAAFDSERPSWLDDPDFVPVDTSVPNLAGSEFADVDFNRPELGADFDAPDLFAQPSRRADDPYAAFPDDIDEPYDHRIYHDGRPAEDDDPGWVDEGPARGRRPQRGERPGAPGARPGALRPGQTPPGQVPGRPGPGGGSRPVPDQFRTPEQFRGPRPDQAGRPGSGRPGQAAGPRPGQAPIQPGVPSGRPGFPGHPGPGARPGPSARPGQAPMRPGQAAARAGQAPVQPGQMPGQPGQMPGQPSQMPGQPGRGAGSRPDQAAGLRPDQPAARGTATPRGTDRFAEPAASGRARVPQPDDPYRRRDQARPEDLDVRPGDAYERPAAPGRHTDPRMERPVESDARIRRPLNADQRSAARVSGLEDTDARMTPPAATDPRLRRPLDADQRPAARAGGLDDTDARLARPAETDPRLRRPLDADGRPAARVPGLDDSSARMTPPAETDPRMRAPLAPDDRGPAGWDGSGALHADSRTDVPARGDGYDDGVIAARADGQHRAAPDAGRPERPVDPGWHEDATPVSGLPVVGERRDQAPVDETGGPRVIHRATPPVAPRVISKASPPPVPRVIKKADPTPAPRPVGTSVPTPPARVIAAPPAVPAATTGPAPGTPIVPAAATPPPPVPVRPVSPPGTPDPAAAPGLPGPDAGRAPSFRPGDGVSPPSPGAGRDMPPAHGQNQPTSPARPEAGQETPAHDQSRPAPGNGVSDDAARDRPTSPAPGVRPAPSPAAGVPTQAMPRPGIPAGESGGHRSGDGEPVAAPGGPGDDRQSRPAEMGHSGFGSAADLPPAPRSRRAPRTAHVTLSEGDGPWSMVPDAAPPAALPMTGLGRPVSPAAGDVRHAGEPGHRSAPVLPAPIGGDQPIPGAAAPTSAVPAPGRSWIPERPGHPAGTPDAPAPPALRPGWIPEQPPHTALAPAAGQGWAPGHSTGTPAADQLHTPDPTWAPSHDAGPPAAPGTADHDRAPQQPGHPAGAPAAAEAGPSAWAPPAAPGEHAWAPHQAGPAAEASVAAESTATREWAPDQPAQTTPDGDRAPHQPSHTAEAPASDRPTSDHDWAPHQAGHSAAEPDPRPRWAPEPSEARVADHLGQPEPATGTLSPDRDQPEAPAGPPQHAAPHIPEPRPAPAGSPAAAGGPETDGRPAGDGRGHRAETLAMPLTRPAGSRNDQPGEAPAARTSERASSLADQEAATRRAVPAPRAAADSAAQPAAEPPAPVADAWSESEALARRLGFTTGETPAVPPAAAPPDDGPDEVRMGAHAAPYMDPDGTLHNLRPIARLAVSGPDDGPQRVADSEFVGLWFAAKPGADVQPPAPDRTEVEEPAEESATEDAGGHLVIDLDVTDLFGAMARGDQPPAAGPARPPAPAAGHDTAKPATAPVSGMPGSGRLPTTGTDPEADAVRAEVAQRMAVLSQMSEKAPEPEPEPEPLRGRPEALSAADLEAIRWRLDGGTLREVVDDKDALRELGERLDGPLADEADNVVKAGLLSVRAEVYRLLGELGMAAAASRLALAHAESARDVQSTVIAQAELAHVLRLRGDFVEADRLFTRAAAAPVPEPLRSVVHENAGRSCFDQGRHMEALDHFAWAVRLGRPDDTDLAARIGVCLQAVYIHVLRDGWGPYPRSGDQAPVPGVTAERDAGAFDELTAERPIVHPR